MATCPGSKLKETEMCNRRGSSSRAPCHTPFGDGVVALQPSRRDCVHAHGRCGRNRCHYLEARSAQVEPAGQAHGDVAQNGRPNQARRPAKERRMPRRARSPYDARHGICRAAARLVLRSWAGHRRRLGGCRAGGSLDCPSRRQLPASAATGHARRRARGEGRRPHASRACADRPRTGALGPGPVRSPPSRLTSARSRSSAPGKSTASACATGFCARSTMATRSGSSA